MLWPAVQEPPSSVCLTNVRKHNTRGRMLQSHTPDHDRRAWSRWSGQRGSSTNSQCHCAPSTEGHSTERGELGLLFVFPAERWCVVGLPSDHRAQELLPLSPLHAHLSHLITLRLCLSALVSLATCLQQWRELWPQHGRSTVPWRGKARATEIRGDGKLAERLGRKGEWRKESPRLSRTDAYRSKQREQSEGLNWRKEVRQMRWWMTGPNLRKLQA